jgi:hypothetical protein
MRWAWAAAFLALPQGAAAQIAPRVAEVEDGTVRFSYATRAGVEICDQGVRIGDRSVWWRSRKGENVSRNCRSGPAEVELSVRRGLVRDVGLVRDERDRSTDVVDLGLVTAEEAASYLLSLAYQGADGDAAEDAVFPATLAAADDVWRELLAIAKDRSLRADVRKSTLFWIGQAAAEAATAGLSEVARAEDEEQEVRDAAVFALSQRPYAEGVPILMEIARDAEQAHTRRTAMFWLAQSDDDRVVAFFEDILLGRIR